MQEVDKKKCNSVCNAMDFLFSKLDEAIDDMENGRVLTEEEAWKEIDEIQLVVRWSNVIRCENKEYLTRDKVQVNIYIDC